MAWWQWLGVVGTLISICGGLTTLIANRDAIAKFLRRERRYSLQEIRAKAEQLAREKKPPRSRLVQQPEGMLDADDRQPIESAAYKRIKSLTEAMRIHKTLSRR